MEPDLPALARLREPLPPGSVSKLPVNVSKDGAPAACRVCHGWHRPARTHLDYAGHAAVTDRLLEVDATWNWRPLAFDADGLPRLVTDKDGSPRGLWILLAVAGVERLGYGSVEAGKADAIKELVGDAVRNAAMRFGVGLALWHKGELPAAELPAAVDALPADDAGAWAAAAIAGLSEAGRVWLRGWWRSEAAAGRLPLDPAAIEGRHRTDVEGALAVARTRPASGNGAGSPVTAVDAPDGPSEGEPSAQAPKVAG